MRRVLRIRSRLLSSFLLIALIGGLMGGTGIFYVRALSRQATAMLKETSSPMLRLFNLYESVLQSQAYARDFLLLDKGKLDKLDSDIARRDAFLKSGTDELMAEVQDPALNAAIGAFRQVWGEFRAGLALVEADARAGKGASAAGLMYSVMESKSQSLNDVMNLMVDGFLGLANQRVERAQAAARSSTIILLALLALGLVLSVTFGLLVSTALAGPLRKAAEAAGAIARGELAVRVDERSLARGDEVGDLARALSEMAADLNGGMCTIRDSVRELEGTGTALVESLGKASSAVAEIGAGIEAVTQKAIDQSSGVEETAATVNEMSRTIEGLDRQIEVQAQGLATSASSIEEMIGNIGSVAASVSRLGHSFDGLVAAAEDGKTKLEGVTGMIKDVAAQSDKLREANSVVASIAAKTNLLAMNAAIESAHAGDAGMGFAVVADEIRSLAEGSAVQSKEISKDIAGIRRSIEAVVAESATAQAAFASVVQLIKSLRALELEINNALEEQREGSRSVLEALATIKEVTATVRAGSSELRVGSAAIGTEMGTLQGATVVLKEAADGIARSMAEIASVTSAVSSLTERNRAAIRALESLLNRYFINEEAAAACLEAKPA